MVGAQGSRVKKHSCGSGGCCSGPLICCAALCRAKKHPVMTQVWHPLHKHLICPADRCTPRQDMVSPQCSCMHREALAVLTAVRSLQEK